ncbi:MAG TPA: hypothetical protein VMV77_10320, partial [Bacteroidales bacterium]|nr:hypothetical protein [Bacteroidales bacterium]
MLNYLIFILGCPNAEVRNKEYRGKGLDVLMGVKILQSGINHKMDTVDSHLVLENNTRMRSEYERI